jgi:hypothetical protein
MPETKCPFPSPVFRGNTNLESYIITRLPNGSHPLAQPFSSVHRLEGRIPETD